jgi:hypothetical protein
MSEISPVLLALKEDFEANRDLFIRISDEILSNRISRYPVFAASEDPLELGRLILHTERSETNYNYFVTFLEELIQKQVIEKDKIQLFKEHYKNPEVSCCFLLIFSEDAGIVFIPFQEEV